MRSLRAVAFAAALALSAAASAEIPVSPLGDIYESYNDCLKVAQPSGLSTDTLAALGWTRATKSTKEGKPTSDGPIIFGNMKRKPLIVLSAERGEGICIVLARIETVKSFAEFLKAWGGNLPAADKDGTISFYDEGHLIQIRQTGSPDKPALTMSVMTPTKKR